MREAVGIPAGILVYFLATIILLLFFRIIFDVPREWSYLITATTAIISFKVACAAAINFSTETGVKIFAVMLAIFWVITLGFDVFGFVTKTIDILSASHDSAKELGNFKELVEVVWNSRICAGVTTILAFGTLGK